MTANWPTLGEINAAVRKGEVNKYAATSLMLARRHAGLCDHCPSLATREDGACDACGGDR